MTARSAPRGVPRRVPPAVRPILAPDGSSPGAPVAPPTRGKLFYDFEIPDAYLGGLPGITNKIRWVREHLPRATRVQIGRASAWYESDVLAYLATLQGTAYGVPRAQAS